jgi:hypothetical protein
MNQKQNRMRKLISILSATCLLLALSVTQAKATTYTDPVSFTFNGDTVQGVFTLDTTAKSLSFDGTVTTAAGQTYDIVAEGDITGQAPRLTLSGSITISQGGVIIKQITINQTASSEWAAIDDFLMKLLAALPH